MWHARSSTDVIDERDTRIDDLFHNEYRGMVRLAYALIGDNQRAEDIVQDGFIDVLRRLDEVRQPAAYLRTAVVSRCRSELRRRRVRALQPPEPADDLSLGADDLWDVLAKLTEDQREDDEQEVIVMLAPSDTNTPRPRWVVPAALATAAAGVLAVIGAVMLRDTSDNNAEQLPVATELPTPAVTTGDRSIELTGDQQAAIAVVIAHNDAQNARDGETMLATLTADAVWTAVFDGKAQNSLTAEDYVAVVMGYGPASTTFTGEPIVSRDLRVAVTAHRDTDANRDGLMVYELQKVDGQLRIAAIYWMS